MICHVSPRHQCGYSVSIGEGNFSITGPTVPAKEAESHPYKSLPHQQEFLFIINGMNIPDRIVTEMELRRNTGERGTRKFISYQGIIYDVTDCPKWRLDMHEQLHFPGQDLSSELIDAPHAEDVFSRPCVKIIGRLNNPESKVS